MLEHPPKKPGGVVRSILFMLGIFMGIGGVHGDQPVGEFDDEEFSEDKTEADNVDLSLDGSVWVLIGKAMLGVTFLLFALFRKKLGRLREEWSIAMEVLDPFAVLLEKFVIRHNINRDNVPLMRSVLMTKLTREFFVLPDDAPDGKVALFFSNIESEINMLCVDGNYKGGDAVELHLERLWKLNKSHERLKMTDGGGRSERLIFYY